MPFPQLEEAGFDDGRLQGLPWRPAICSARASTPSRRARYFNALPASRDEFDHEVRRRRLRRQRDRRGRLRDGRVLRRRQVLILPGLRYESTKVDYLGYDVRYDEDGDYVSTRPVTGGDTYGVLAARLSCALQRRRRRPTSAPPTRARWRVRTTTTSCRTRSCSSEDEEIQRGNSALKPTTSNNLDLLVEHYFQSVGVVSGGVFYKRLDDYIYPSVFDEDGVRRRVRGDAAAQRRVRRRLWGLELAFQNQLRFLPAPLDGLGVYANYTWTDSSATLPGREGEDATLPGQSAHVGNVSRVVREGAASRRRRRGTSTASTSTRWARRRSTTSTTTTTRSGTSTSASGSRATCARLRRRPEPDQRAAALLPGRDQHARSRRSTTGGGRTSA